MRGSWLLVSVAVISCEKKPPPPPAFYLSVVAGTRHVRAMQDTGNAVIKEDQV